MKRCPTCTETKSLDSFYNNKSTKDGKDMYCKLCRHKISNRYARQMTAEQRARVQAQKIASCMRLYGKPFTPYAARRKKERLAQNVSSNLSSSTNASQQTRDAIVSSGGQRASMVRQDASQ